MTQFRDGPIEVTLTRIDLLIFCYYWLNVSKKKHSKITINKIILYLGTNDYNYIGINHFNIRNDLKRLFPIKMNNRKRIKYFKINNTWILFWGSKFNINYNQHKQIFETFNKIENGTLSF